MQISIEAMLDTCKANPRIEVKLKPYDCGSWRGIYAEAAIFVKEEASTLKEWIPFLEKLLTTRAFEGYKGGEFSFHPFTALHIEYAQSHASDTLWLKLFQNSKLARELEIYMENCVK